MTKILRHFVEIPDGQAHYRTCGEPALPPLVMFHGSPGSSYSLVPLMRHLAAGRHVYAIDTVGNGDSSPASAETPDIAHLAESHFHAARAIGLTRFDVYGYHTGAAICTELSIRHPEALRRIVMDGVSVFDPGSAASLLGNNHAPDIPIDLEGTQLMKAWTMVRDAHVFWPWWDRRGTCRRALGLPSAEYLHGEVIEVLKACRTYFKSYRAALNYPKRERLPQVRHPTLVCGCPTDQLYGHMDAAAALIPGATKRETPERQREEDLAAAARIMLEFLDGEARKPGSERPPQVSHVP
jgi:pimeloyl-ACP methyl ester carboxylesterase